MDGRGRLAFPGVVDAHQHWGIYNPLSDDTATESRACAQGGVTTALTYMRTGQYYLNRGGPYADFFPHVLAAAEGRSYVDYGFHLAPMSGSTSTRSPRSSRTFGVTSFKIFMFYGSHGLHGRSANQSSFLMIPEDERYDLAHFEFVMRGVQAAREKLPGRAPYVSLSLHCETAEIMTAYTKLVEENGTLPGPRCLQRVAAAALRGPRGHHRVLPRPRDRAADDQPAAPVVPQGDEGRDADGVDVPARRLPPRGDDRPPARRRRHRATGIGGKVNPPLRPREDVEALWEHVLAGERQLGRLRPRVLQGRDEVRRPARRLFAAKSGFGGAEYLLPGLVSEGRRRGLSHRGSPSSPRGTRPGASACAARAHRPRLRRRPRLVDPDRRGPSTPADSESTQEYTPFEGLEYRRDRRHDVPARRAHRARRAGGGRAGGPLPAPSDVLIVHSSCTR